jgi:hypothetical protein
LFRHSLRFKFCGQLREILGCLLHSKICREENVEMTSGFRSRHTYLNVSQTSVESYYRRPRPQCADQGLFVMSCDLSKIVFVTLYIQKQLFCVVATFYLTVRQCFEVM